MTELSTVNASHEWDRNDKYVWNVYLNRSNELVRGGLQDTLTSIAVSCWGYGGDAVFLARAKVDTFSFAFDTCPAPIASREFASFQKNNELKIYPNPAHNLLTIEGLEIKEAEIRIMSISGLILKTIKNNGSEKMEIGINDLPNGMYFISISGNDTKNKILKFIKQR